MLCFSCSRDAGTVKENNSAQYIINYPGEREKEFNISQVARSTEYVVLEAKSESLIGEIQKVVVANDRLFVFDKEVLETIFVFNRNGEYLFSLETGLGAEGELLSIQDVAIDEENRLIYIADSEMRRLMIYDWNGKYIDARAVSTFIESIEVSKEGNGVVFRNIIFAQGDEYNNHQIVIFDSNGEIVSQQLKLKEGQNEFAFLESMHPLFSSNDEVYFSSALSETVYKITTENAEPVFSLNLGSKSILPEAEQLTYTAQFAPLLTSGDYTVPVGHNYVLNKSLVSFLRARGNYETLVFDMASGSTGTYKKLNNDLDGMQLFLPVSYSGGYWVGVTPGELLSSVPKEDWEKRFPSQMNNKLSALGADPDMLNPTLILFDVK